MSTSPDSPEKLKDSDAVDTIDTVQGVQLERNFSFLAILGVAFSILNSWTGESFRRTALTRSYVGIVSAPM